MENEFLDIVPSNEPAAATPAASDNPFLDVVPDLKDEQRQGLEGSLFVAGQTTPDKAAEAIKVGNQYSVDPMFAHDNLDQLKSSSPRETAPIDQLLEYYPGVTSFFQKPENAAVAHDDLENLQKIDRGTHYASGNYLKDIATQAVPSGFNDFQKSLVTLGLGFGFLDKDSAKANLDSLDREAKSLKASEPDYVAAFDEAMKESSGDFGRAIERFKNISTDLKRGEVLQALKDYYAGGISSIGALLDKTVTTAVNPRALGYQATKGAVDLAPMIAAGLSASISAPISAGATFLAGAPSIVGQWFQTKVAESGKSLDQVLSDPKTLSQIRSQALRGGLTESAVYSLLPLFGGAGAEAKVLSAGQLAKDFAAGTAKGSATMAGAHVAGEVASGGKPDIPSAINSFFDNLGVAAVFEAAHTAGKFAKPREQFQGEALPKEAPVAEAVDAEGRTVPKQLTSGPEAPSAREKYPVDPVDALTAVAADTHTTMTSLQGLQALDEMGQAVRESKLAERVPDKVAELIEASGGKGQVFFQTDDWDKHFTERGLSPSQAADQIMGDGGKAYQEAKESGAAFQIPLAQYVAKMAKTEHFDPLLNFVKTSEEGMTFSEAKDHIEKLPETVNQIAENRHADEAKVLGAQIEQELIAAGRPPEEARHAATIAESRMRARSSITGISPREYVDRYKTEIVGPNEPLRLAEEPQVLNQSGIEGPPKTLAELRSKIESGAKEIYSAPDASEVYAKLPDSFEGKLLSADVAREMVPEYAAGGDLRVVAVDPTNDTAGEFIQKELERKIAEPADSYAIFMSGGPGSGKTTASQTILKEAVERSDFTFDGIMANFDKAIKNIDATLASGRPVIISHVYRFGVDALRGIADRFKLQGRSIPYAVASSAHVRAQETFFRLMDHYRGNNDIHFQAIDNSGPNSKFVPLSELEKVRYTQGGKSVNRATKDLGKIAKEVLSETAKETKAAEARVEAGLQNQTGNPGEIRAGQEGTSASNNQGVQGSGPQGPAGNALNQGGPPRGSIEFGKYSALIKLGEKADASTYIHESFHQWTVQEYRDDYNLLKSKPESELTDRQRLFLKDAEALLKEAGADSFEKVTREGWEKIAEMGESYLKDGRAPSKELESAFKRFKKWISALYRAMRRKGIRLSDDIRGVFDRMIAAEDEIRKAQPEFSEGITAGMSEKQASDYQALRADLKDYSENKLRESLLSDLKRQQSKEYKDRRAEIRARIEADINEQPEYIALSALKDDKMPDGSDLPDGFIPMKLSKEAIIHDYGEEIAAALPKGIFDKEFGVHPDMAAEIYGFDSGEDMLKVLAAAPEKESLIEEMTDVQMKEERPDLLDEPQLSEEAVKAAHNEKRAQLLRMELEHLASSDFAALKGVIRKISRRVPSDQEVRQRAQSFIDSKNIENIRPYEFVLAERKAAKQAGELLAKGDIDGAFEAKRKELLNHELYRAAVEAQEVVQNSVTQFKKISRSDEDLSKSRDTDLVNAARALIAQYGFGKRPVKIPMDYLGQIKTYDPDKYQTLLDVIGPMSASAKNYRELSFSDFKELRSAFDALWSLARSEKEIDILAGKISVEEAASRVVEALQKWAPKKKEGAFNRSLTNMDKTAIDLRFDAANWRIMESLIDQWDLGDSKGVMSELFTNPAFKGTEDYRDMKVQVMTKLDAALKEFSPSLTRKKIMAHEIGYEFADKSFLVGALLHTGNDSNLSKLLRGRGWGEFNEDGSLNRSRWDSFIDRMQKEGTLTKRDYDFVQRVWDIFEETKPFAQKAHKQIRGFYFDEVTANPFKTPFGEYRGGYVPAKADPYESRKARTQEQINELERREKTFAHPSTGAGFAKSRVEDYAVPLELSLGMVKAALDWELRFAFIEPRIDAIRRLLRNNEINQAITDANPTAIEKVFIPWMQRMADQKISEPGNFKTLDKLARWFKTGANLQTLALDLSNSAQQLTGFGPGNLKVPYKFLRNGYFSYLGAPLKTAKLIQEKSAFMRHHTSNQLGQIEESIYTITLNPSMFQRVGDFAEAHSTLLARISQGIVDHSVWMGAYNFYHAEAPIDMPLMQREAQAVHYADRAVRLTQGSAFPEHMAGVAGGTPTAQAVKMYSNYWIMLGNLLLSESIQARAKSGGPKHTTDFGGGWTRHALIWGVAFAATAVAANWISRFSSGNVDRNDDHSISDDLLSSGLEGILTTGLSLVPGGRYASGVYFALKGNQSDVKLGFSPAMGALEKGLRGSKELYSSVKKNKPLNGKEIQDVMTLLGLITKLPLAPAARPLSYSVDVKQGRIQKPANPLDALRGLATGKGKPKKR